MSQFMPSAASQPILSSTASDAPNIESHSAAAPLACLTTIIEHIPAVVYVKNAADRSYMLINKAAERYYGVPRERMLGRTADDVFAGAAAAYIREQDSRVLDARAELSADEHEIVTPDGKTCIVTTMRAPVFDPSGAPQYIVTVINDVTARRRAEDKVAFLAYHDALTELGNRAAFNEHIKAVSDMAAAAGGAFGVVFVDLDRFKDVNDTFGHVAGDALLRDVAHRLRAAAADAFICRIGGDEFAIIVARQAEPAALAHMCRDIHARMEPDLQFEGASIEISVSVGAAIYPNDGGDVQSLLNAADAALYRAKADGRGVTCFFEPGMDLAMRERHALHQDLRLAVARGEFLLHYQPLAEVGGDVVGFEALIRWNHPERGMIAPDTFVALAEETGLIVPIGRWVLREACREAASWERPLKIAINVSAIQLKHDNFANTVRTVLDLTGLDPRRLEIEVTESVLMTDTPATLANLHEIKALGVSVSMDDFGTGYSSLSYLQSFPFDKIKIDRSFVASLTSNDQSAAIVRAVLGLGRGLNLPITAEGVETGEQLAFLSAESCDHVQGYLIGRPQPIDAYRDILSAPAQHRRA